MLGIEPSTLYFWASTPSIGLTPRRDLWSAQISILWKKNLARSQSQECEVKRSKLRFFQIPVFYTPLIAPNLVVKLHKNWQRALLCLLVLSAGVLWLLCFFKFQIKSQNCSFLTILFHCCWKKTWGFALEPHVQLLFVCLFWFLRSSRAWTGTGLELAETCLSKPPKLRNWRCAPRPPAGLLYNF